MKGRTYKYMEDDPMYPFGFGMSYSEFSYGKAEVSSGVVSEESPVQLSVEVSNTGAVKSDEVVQLYVKDLKASVQVPNFQLAGVRRISLDPNETRKVTFQLSHNMFEMVNESGDRIVEPGDFKVFVGGSSPMKRSFELGAPKMAETMITVE
jgi:beta-glucosidase